MTTSDVIIVGGGIAGCATALSVSRTNPQLTVMIIDNGDPNTFQVGESLPSAAKHALFQIIPQFRSALRTDQRIYLRSAGNASAWSKPEVEYTDSILSPLGAGFHLDRAAFNKLLKEQTLGELASRCAGNSLYVHGNFCDIESDPQDASLWLVQVRVPETRTGSEIESHRCRWIIDASGRTATAARKLGGCVIKYDSLIAFYLVFAAMPINEDKDFHTTIEASSSGWWYSSQLPGRTRIVVYHTDDNSATAKTVRTTDGFMDLMKAETTHILRMIQDGDYDVASSITRHPVCTAAGSTFLRPSCGVVGADGPRWAAVGDAAIAFDPLSSQGMTTALMSGTFVGQVAAGHLTNGVAGQTPEEIIADRIEQTRFKYTIERDYFYRQVDRFESEFWRCRQVDETST